MAQLLSRKIIISIVIFVLLLVIYAFVWPAISKARATSHLRNVSSLELQPLLQPVSALMQGVRPKSILECDEVSHTHTSTRLYCQDVISYKYDPTPLSDASRSKVIDEANNLDKALTQHGWTIDRPQDKIKTVAESVPTAPLQPFHGGGVPFHKNIDDISCNLEVSFGGPTDGSSPGTINIDRFSCQQNVSYFMLHMSNYVNQGFGG